MNLSGLAIAGALNGSLQLRLLVSGHPVHTVLCLKIPRAARNHWGRASCCVPLRHSHASEILLWG